jgi:hypothetical protein
MHAEVRGVVDRRFDTQHRALLVVHPAKADLRLQRVAVQPMFDAHAFGTDEVLRHDLAVEADIHPALGNADL